MSFSVSSDAAPPSYNGVHHVLAVPQTVSIIPTVFQPPQPQLADSNMAFPVFQTPQITDTSAAAQGKLAWGYTLIDAHNRNLPRIPVPKCKIAGHTHALSNFFSGQGGEQQHQTLCLNHHRGDCRHGSACNHFHVDRAYVEHARSETRPLCCTRHFDYFSQHAAATTALPHLTKFILVMPDGSEHKLSCYDVGYTFAMEMLFRDKNGYARIDASKRLCRLHRDGKCRWTKDCSHIHVCTQALQLFNNFSLKELSTRLMDETLTSFSDVKEYFLDNKHILQYIGSPYAVGFVDDVFASGRRRPLKVLMKFGAKITAEQLQTLVHEKNEAHEGMSTESLHHLERCIDLAEEYGTRSDDSIPASCTCVNH